MRSGSEFEWKGAAGPFTLVLEPGVFTPSRTSVVVSQALEVSRGETVLDLGCGSGVLSFVAARLGAKRVIGCDVSEEAVRCAENNSRRLGLEEVTEFRVGDLLEPVADVRADAVIADVSGIPDAVAAATGWFPDGRGGGPTGAELPVAMLEGIGKLMAPGGRAYLPTGTIQDEEKVLAAARAVFGGEVEPLVSRDFPLPQHVVDAPAVARLIEAGVIRPHTRRDRHWWRLTVWRCRLD